jgi:hypothetical protein
VNVVQSVGYTVYVESEQVCAYCAQKLSGFIKTPSSINKNKPRNKSTISAGASKEGDENIVEFG